MSDSPSEPAAGTDTPDRRVPWYQNPWVWGVIFGLIFIPLIRPLTRRVPPPPPVMGSLPAFTLVDQDGEPFGTEQMKGDVYVVGFFFVDCRTLCPRILAAMNTLEDKYTEMGFDVKLLAVSVDPENDTPAKMKKKAEEFGADFSRWTFVTGDLATVRQVVEGGFNTAMGDRITDGATGIVDIAHTEKLVLVDWQGGLRGYYGIDELGLDEVYHRSRHVLRQKAELGQ